MSILFLAWRSLIWEPRELPIAGAWERGGPTLPVEFCRVSSSRKRALTLVTDQSLGAWVSTRFAVGRVSELREAVDALAKREGTSWIAYVTSRGDRKCRHDIVCESVAAWLPEAGVEAAVWTDLTSNFEREVGIPFSVPAALEYLRSLPSDAAVEARRYILSAPEEVQTPLRRAVENDAWFTEAAPSNAD